MLWQYLYMEGIIFTIFCVVPSPGLFVTCKLLRGHRYRNALEWTSWSALSTERFQGAKLWQEQGSHGHAQKQEL